MRLDTNLIYTHNLQTSNFENPALPDFENRVLGELGDPKDEFQWFVDLTKGVATFGYKMHYIGPMWTGAFEDFNELEFGMLSSWLPAVQLGLRRHPQVSGDVLPRHSCRGGPEEHWSSPRASTSTAA